MADKEGKAVMRKKYLRCIVIFSCLFLFCSGCGFSSGKNTSAGNGIVEDSENASIDGDGEIPEDPPGQAPEGDPQWFLNGVSYDEESITELLGFYQNLSPSENLFFDIPEKCRLYKYNYEVLDRPNQPYAQEFYEAFQAVFPERTMDENCLYYVGNDSKYSNEDGLNLVKGHEDEIFSDTSEVVYFSYDESKDGKAPVEGAYVSLELGNPAGYGYGGFNRGKTAAISMASSGRDTFYSLTTYDPEGHFPSVGYYSPKSEQSFPLADKEVKIRDAAAFVEKYMAELPVPKESNMEVSVKDVNVLKIAEGQYGYSFLIVGTFDGVPMDYARSVLYSSSLRKYALFTGGQAFMLESDELDIVNRFRKKQNVVDQEELTEGISLEKAISLLSAEVTAHVSFEVERIELVYRIEYIPTERGYFNIETNAQKFWPSWRFMLYNANDGLTYVFYVDAATGELDHFTTEGRLTLLK